MGLEDKRIVLLEEWTFDEEVLRLGTQLLWLEGKPVTLSRPQSQTNIVGHKLYLGTAPIFMTTKAKDLRPIQEAAEWARRQGKPSAHTMLLRRLKVHHFDASTPVAGGVSIPECGVCFARLALKHSTHGRQPAMQPAVQPIIDEVDYDDL